MHIIAHIENAFQTKFGIPRQSGLVSSLQSKIIFESLYRNPDAVRGLEDYSHIWLIWQFSDSIRENWSPTVRPPRLGGNQRMGVFATRSPFRPNPIGLSVVQLERIAWNEPESPILYVNGADLMNGTPIYDIKPYLPHIDSHPEASGGFAVQVANYALQVIFPVQWLSQVPVNLQKALYEILEQDPRPSYHHDPNRTYGFYFADLEIRFTVQENILTVCSVTKQMKNDKGEWAK